MRSSRKALLLVSPMPVIVLLVVYLTIGVPIERHHVSLPPDDASAPRVVRAYFDALDGNDASTQEALWVPGRPRFWPANRIRAVHELGVGEPATSPSPDPAEEPALAAFPLRAQVSAWCRLEYWPLHGLNDQDNGILIGHTWLLVRKDADDPWRIWSQGFFG